MSERDRVSEIKALQALADGAENYASLTLCLNFPPLLPPGGNITQCDLGAEKDDIQAMRFYGWATASANRWGFMLTNRDPSTLLIASTLDGTYAVDSPTLIFSAGPAATAIPIVDIIGTPKRPFRYLVMFDEDDIDNLELTVCLERSEEQSGKVIIAVPA